MKTNNVPTATVVIIHTTNAENVNLIKEMAREIPSQEKHQIKETAHKDILTMTGIPPLVHPLTINKIRQTTIVHTVLIATLTTIAIKTHPIAGPKAIV